ncbi:MAG: hypothetical protein K2X41_09185 [Hyphomicrobium sp.]|nr:hypothetical protein [Hyphomicrobium sp.]
MTEAIATVPVDADAALDQLIIGCTTTEWCKIAVLIARATDAARADQRTVSGQSIAQRIYVLADSRRLDVRGNVRRWRAGEVRAVAATDA